MKKKIQQIKEKIAVYISILKEEIFINKKGRLSWQTIIKLALRNLANTPSRSLVTIGAMAIGTAAVVVLVSFAYGLEDIVTKRLIQPNSLRLADIQTSSTAVGLTKQKIEELKKINGVAELAPAVSLVSSLNINDSKMDVITIGVENRYLEYLHTQFLYGRNFSKEAEKKFLGKTDLEELIAQWEKGEVGGETEEKESIQLAQPISSQKVFFRLNDESYYPLRDAPNMKAAIIGFVQGTLFQRESGIEVYGGVYESVSSVGKFYQDKKGQWWGKWIKTKMPIFEEREPGFYMPALNEAGNQRYTEGYLAEKDVKVLSQQEVSDEQKIEKLLKKFKSEATSSSILGEATGSATNEEDLVKVTFGQTSTVSAALSSSSTDSTELEKIVSLEKKSKQATQTAELAFIEVKKQGGKEIIISSAILKNLRLKSNQLLNKEVSLSYIISGNLIPNVAGRAISKPVKYKIVGIIKDDKQSLIFVPLSDLESMGISRYTSAKVLAKNETILANVREKIEALGFNTLSIVDTLAQVDRLFRVMRFLLGAFGMIALVVAIFGMFNTLTVSLLERTREVGVMKTLGTNNKDILRLFLAESLIIGLFGGLVGIGLGQWVGHFVNFISSFFREDKNISLFKTPVSFMLFILGLSLLVGLLTGLYPAKRSQKINPLDALRYE